MFEAYLQSLLPIPAQSLQAFVQLFHPMTLEKDAHFANVGERATQIAFVQNGVMRAYFSTSGGKEYNKTFFVTSEFAGAYSSLVTQNESRIAIQCLTPCQALVARWSDVVSLYPQHRSIETLARVLAEQFFVIKEQREVDLVTLDSRQRYQRFQHEYPGLEQLIPQYHIASYLAITPTQLSRIRKPH